MLGDVRRPAAHPVLVAQRLLGGERHHDHSPIGVGSGGVAGADGQLHRLVGHAEQRGGRPEAAIDGAPADGDDDVALVRANSGGPQRGAGFRIARLAGQDAVDPPPAVGRREVGAEFAEPAREVAGLDRRHHVGVRRVELADHLPQHVDEIVVRGDALEQRPIEVDDPRPVDAVHVGAPEVVGHQAHRLFEHLTPLGHRVELEVQSADVDRHVVGVVGLHGVVGRPHRQRLLLADDHTAAVAARRVAVGLAEHLQLALREGEVLQQIRRLVGHAGAPTCRARRARPTRGSTARRRGRRADSR